MQKEGEGKWPCLVRPFPRPAAHPRLSSIAPCSRRALPEPEGRARGSFYLPSYLNSVLSLYGGLHAGIGEGYVLRLRQGPRAVMPPLMTYWMKTSRNRPGRPGAVTRH